MDLHGNPTVKTPGCRRFDVYFWRFWLSFAGEESGRFNRSTAYNVFMTLYFDYQMQLASRMFSQQSEVTGGISLSGFRLVLKFFIFFPKSFNTTRCVNQFLFASKKRMAFGAYFNADIGLGRTDLYLVATRTTYAGISVFRMNAVFHCIFNPQKLNVSECLPWRVKKINSSGLPNLPRGWKNRIVIHI